MTKKEDLANKKIELARKEVSNIIQEVASESVKLDSTKAFNKYIDTKVSPISNIYGFIRSNSK